MIVAAIAWLVGVVALDLGWRRAPNAWLLAGAALALLALALGRSPMNIDWLAALIGAGAGFAALLLFYAMGLMGAGDVKFAGVLGLWFGWLPLVPIAMAAGLLAGTHAVLWLLWRHWPRPQPAGALQAVAATQVRPIPYAGYLALAALGWIGLARYGAPA